MAGRRDLPERPDWSGHHGIASWTKYFDDLDAALHEFEGGLSQQHFSPLPQLVPPAGMPPEQLRGRSEELYLRISELEFRAQFLREELRAEIARLPRSRAISHGKVEWNFGRALDING